MLQSHSIVFSDFESAWYKKWAKLLKQTKLKDSTYSPKANKFWQNAIMAQVLHERGVLKSGKMGIGFGVGKERLPALFASLGIKVTATDQDFTTDKAKKWDNDQLARGAFDLNEDGICGPGVFQQNTTFLSVDMCKFPAKLSNQYDFVWSNCALGHLGSINKGLEFIENSLGCLKPGGWAVHTTEANVASNDITSDSGATVVFRMVDLYKLGIRLSKRGYICSAFHLIPGNSELDSRVSLDPQFGTDYSKILINGHIATQIVLIIQSPVRKLSHVVKLSNYIKHYVAYQKNKVSLHKIASTNPTLKLLEKSRGLKPSDYKIRPIKKLISLSREDSQVVIEYVNDSNYALTGLHESLFNTKHIILGTDQPVNHDSPLADSTWFMSSRPTLVMCKKAKAGWVRTDYVSPGEHFSFVFQINSKHIKKSYTEHFSVNQEGSGIVPDSTVSVKIL